MQQWEAVGQSLAAAGPSSDQQIAAGRDGQWEGSRLDESRPDVAETAQRLAQPHVQADCRAQRRERVRRIEDIAHDWRKVPVMTEAAAWSSSMQSNKKCAKPVARLARRDDGQTFCTRIRRGINVSRDRIDANATFLDPSHPTHGMAKNTT